MKLYSIPPDTHYPESGGSNLLQPKLLSARDPHGSVHQSGGFFRDDFQLWEIGCQQQHENGFAMAFFRD